MRAAILRPIRALEVAKPVLKDNMKQPKPELYNNRVIYLFLQFISAPFRLARGLYCLAKRGVHGCKSDETNRADDQLRQSRARRQLRGLPPDHVQVPPSGS
jgi:hypothetical protein